MSTDHQTELRRLREMNAKRTPGEWFTHDKEHIRHKDADGGSYRIAVVESWDRIGDNAEFIAALANACPWLLDAAERGLEAESAYRDALRFADDNARIGVECEISHEQLEAERDAWRESLVLADAMANELRIAAMQAYIGEKIDIQRLEALAATYAAARQQEQSP